MSASKLKLTRWKKIALAILAGLAILLTISISLIFLFFYMLADATCNTVEIYQIEYSPNRQYKAMVYEFDCGATTSYSTDISIFPYDANTPDRRGNIAIIDGHQDWNNARVTWIDNRNLLIEYEPDWMVFGGDRRHWLFIKIDYLPALP